MALFKKTIKTLPVPALSLWFRASCGFLPNYVLLPTLRAQVTFPRAFHHSHILLQNVIGQWQCVWGNNSEEFCLPQQHSKQNDLSHDPSPLQGDEGRSSLESQDLATARLIGDKSFMSLEENPSTRNLFNSFPFIGVDSFSWQRNIYSFLKSSQKGCI